MAPSGSRSAKRKCQRVVHWIPVLFVCALVAWSYYAYVIQLCVVIYLMAYHVSFIMFVWSYWQTIFTKPVNPLKQFHLSHTDKELLKQEDRAESQQEILRRIAKDLPISTRTTSGGELSLQDFLTARVNNCVGFSNYKFFTLFLAYSLLYCLLITATDLQYFIQFWTNGLPDTQAKFHIMFLFFAASMFSVSLASLFAYHCWLICKNRSTLEVFRAPAFLHGADKNGFSLGVSKNFHQVFGDKKKYWLLPVFSSQGDGCFFPTCLVNPDPEQPASPSAHAVKSDEEAHQFPSKPLRESQSRLLSNGQTWTDSDETEERGREDPRAALRVFCGTLEKLLLRETAIIRYDGFPCNCLSRELLSYRRVYTHSDRLQSLLRRERGFVSILCCAPTQKRCIR
ncbi:Palmitoyltransferase ZDHHC2 [Bagarius yarrelli]|uniref:Palmitoyltransferase n=1 Tax=Bagarius yarrelli TaxID=175774 RepID=A0A556UXR3_BAGYA|nr:Palmitoyltransferase ZDHHC2 [Bagarius yarrelli]